ncbi:MAG TPA: hypothetical protein VKV80_13715 [Streptosporangiaceae bacterium]|nr:hypothetical protein [Streptosporangiaceae bacterium]
MAGPSWGPGRAAIPFSVFPGTAVPRGRPWPAARPLSVPAAVLTPGEGRGAAVHQPAARPGRPPPGTTARPARTASTAAADTAALPGGSPLIAPPRPSWSW